MTLSPTVPALVQQDFLDMYDRILPPSWLTPIKAIGPGYELLQGFASVGARVSLAQQNLGLDLGFLTAQAGAYATGVVQLSRPTTATSGAPTNNNNQGDTASIVSGASAGNMRVTGVANMSAADVGKFLIISNTFYNQNTGYFLIAQVNGATSVDVVNANAIVPDLTNGAIQWQEQDFTVTVKAGTVVTTSGTGRDFITQQDQVFLWNDLGPFDVPVVSVAQGYEYNVLGTLVTAGGETVPGDIDTVKTLLEYPPFQDLTIRVSNLDATSGGRDDALDALGSDRGMPRLPNESDTAYRGRLRQLPQAVTPVAIVDAVDSLFAPINSGYTILETWAPTLQTCWDAPNAEIVGSDFNPTLFCWDDPRPNFPFQDRWLDDSCVMAGVVVIVEDVQPIAEYGMCWDDESNTGVDVPSQSGSAANIVSGAAAGNMRVSGLTGMVLADVGEWLTLGGAQYTQNNGTFQITNYVSATVVDVVAFADNIVSDPNNGAISWQQVQYSNTYSAANLVSSITDGDRAICVWDQPPNVQQWGYIPGAWDGFDAQKAALYLGLWQTLQQIKPAGQPVYVELEGQ